MYQIKEAAQLSGISVKTLHHYDKTPWSAKFENGRVYSESDLEWLQIIYFYKYFKGNSRAGQSVQMELLPTEETI